MESGADESVIFFQKNLRVMHVMEYRKMRFALHASKLEFIRISNGMFLSFSCLEEARKGLQDEQVHFRQQLCGLNSMQIRLPSIPELLINEILHPFNVFQIFSIILWSLDDYYLYAGAIFLLSTLSSVTTLIETRRNLRSLDKMAKFDCNVMVLRNSEWKEENSASLVIGDVIQLNSLIQTIPCDLVQLTGDSIVNESMLTGESIPVSKIPITERDIKDLSITASSKYILFSGTCLIRARASSLATAMVINAGFDTAKGSLIRSILYPKPNKFKFYQDSFKFIGALALIAAIGFSVTVYFLISLETPALAIVKRALDLITIVIPPALPATMSIGTAFAIRRLQKLKIYCISPPRVNICGKLNLICFDKTGTLTEEGLDVFGLSFTRLSDDDSVVFSDFVHEFDDIPADNPLRLCMASCHSLKSIDDEMVGDPIDLKMFQFSKWIMKEPEDLNGGLVNIVRNEECELGVVRCFEFNAQLRRMSVIVKSHSAPAMHVFVKGSPEGLEPLCNRSSLPTNFYDIIDSYTHKGYRVIACATKTLPASFTWLKVQRESRESIESNLQFLGFLVFENKLKEVTRSVLKELKEAKMRTVMCTGDNLLTAVSVSRACEMIPSDCTVFIPKLLVLSPAEDVPKAAVPFVHWDCIDYPHLELDPFTLSIRHPIPADICAKELETYQLACTGEVFEFLMDNAPDLLNRMLMKCSVFARMSPEQKQMLVEKLQALDYCVAFCGDGANDCGALKSSDVGISLSQAEASIAAPFTSQITDIRCVLSVIREGRSALVTSFSSFKFMALYSIIQFTSASLLCSIGTFLTDSQYIYIDLLLILPIAIFISRFQAAVKIAQKRPSAKLISKKIMTSIMGQILLQCIFQLFLMLYTRHRKYEYDDIVSPRKDADLECPENTCIFLLSIFLYMNVAFIYCAGRPHRQSRFSTIPFLSAFSIISFANILLNFSHFYFIAWALIMNLVSLPFLHQLMILMLGCSHFIVANVAEIFIFPFFVSLLSRKKRRRKSVPSKLYKQLLEKNQP